MPRHAAAAFALIAATSAATAAASASPDAARAAAARAVGVDPAFAFAADAFWTAVSFDATRVEEGAAASVIAGLPLWPQGQPDQLRSLWQEMKEALYAANEHWEVWTNWYDDRLEGRVREQERELAYVRIDDDIWNQGPAIVNAEIKRRIEEHGPPEPVPPEPSSGPGLSFQDLLRRRSKPYRNKRLRLRGSV